jgi:hypothetical protein
MAEEQTFADQLREAVRRCGKTRYRISRESGIDEGTLCRFVNGDVGMRTATINILCRYLGARLVVDSPTEKQAAKEKANPKVSRRKK